MLVSCASVWPTQFFEHPQCLLIAKWYLGGPLTNSLMTRWSMDDVSLCVAHTSLEHLKCVDTRRHSRNTKGKMTLAPSYLQQRFGLHHTPNEENGAERVVGNGQMCG